MDDALIFGVVGGSTAVSEVVYLSRALPVTEFHGDLQDMDPTHVLRLAAPCEESRCVHFEGSRCTLGARIVEMVPAVVDVLPRCSIRSTCRWYAEQGGSVCMRCPQVITRDHQRAGNEEVRIAAQPPAEASRSTERHRSRPR
jgi:hypothetical protein